MWWVVFDNKAWGGGGGEENAVRCLVCNFCYRLPRHDMFKVRRFLAYLLLGYIIGLCHLLFFVGGRADLCFLDGFLFLGTEIGRLFSLLWIEDGHEFCSG